MATKSNWIVIPNWNGIDMLPDCLDSLYRQTLPCRVIVVDNGSHDGSVEFIKENFSKATLILHEKNLGFTGGVNAGIKHAMSKGAKYIALFNNDAVADKDWLKFLVGALERDDSSGIATGTIYHKGTDKLDNSGEEFSNWGVAFARGRGSDMHSSAQPEYIFGASGGSTLYRAEMFEEIGIFDDDIFAYYEDADMNWRAQLSGWKALHVPTALVQHEIGGTSKRMSGFTTYQTLKNMPWVVIKNVPLGLLIKMLPRFWLIYSSILFKALLSRRCKYALKGWVMSHLYLPKKLLQRHSVQSSKKVTNQYLDGLLFKGLPPNSNLRKFARLFGRR